MQEDEGEFIKNKVYEEEVGQRRRRFRGGYEKVDIEVEIDRKIIK